MKKLKIVFVLVAICATLFTSCKKDDENVSSPGYFIIDGVKHDLAKAYFDFGDVQKDYHPAKTEYIQHSVAFISDGITLKKDEEVFTGKGDVVAISFMDPLKLQIPAVGDYSFQNDTEPVKSFTYFDFAMIENFDAAKVDSNADTDESKIYEVCKTFKVQKNEEIYEFSSSGITVEGKTFEFYYKGSVLPMPK